MRANAPSLAGHAAIMRIDHWIKNLFVLPGLLVALTVEPKKAAFELVSAMLLGILAIGLVASSNYVINEVLDARYDRENPTKRQRPVPTGQVNAHSRLIASKLLDDWRLFHGNQTLRRVPRLGKCRSSGALPPLIRLL